MLLSSYVYLFIILVCPSGFLQGQNMSETYRMGLHASTRSVRVDRSLRVDMDLFGYMRVHADPINSGACQVHLIFPCSNSVCSFCSTKSEMVPKPRVSMVGKVFIS